MRKGDAAIAAGLGMALALAEIFRRTAQSADGWELIRKNLAQSTALMSETAHLLTDGKVSAETQKAIYGEVIY
jgi:hypothetical protein